MSQGQGEKTEEATPKKLEDARKKGQVWQSKEIVSAATMLGAYIYFFVAWDTVLADLLELMVIPEKYLAFPFRDALARTSQAVWDKMIDLSLPFVLMAAGVAILAQFLHVGPVFSFEPVKPDIKKIDPIAGFKKIFSIKNLVEFLKSVVKVTLLGVILVYVIYKNIQDIILLPKCKEYCITAFIGELMFELAMFSMLAFLIVAFADAFFQKYNHLKEMKMTKDEVKREHKDSEGSPEIRQSRRSFHREILEGGVEEKVKDSSVVITNPSHVAVGLYYKHGESQLPKVTVKGKDFLAMRIKDIAYQLGIPVVENVELARTLFEEVKVDHFIPRKLIEPVAAVLRWLRSQQQ